MKVYKFLEIFSAMLLLSCSSTNELVETNENNIRENIETYTSSDAVRSGIALGGVGTGSIELRKDGNFYNWSIFNNYPHGSGPIFDLPTLPNKDVEDNFMFFVVRYQVEGEKPKIKLLQINNSLQEGGMEGVIYYYPWMEAVEKIEYEGRFPFVNIKFSDSEMPFDINMESFSPFVPHDAKNSSLPGIYFNFEINSKTDKNVDVMLIGSLRNLVGYDTIDKAFASELIEKDNYKFFVHSVDGIDKDKSTYGQMGLGVIGGNEISYNLGWEHKHKYYENLLINKKLTNTDDTENRNSKKANGEMVGRMGKFDNDQRNFSSIAVSHVLKNKENIKQTFFMNWNFPNNYGSVKETDKTILENNKKGNDYRISLKLTKNIGHYYQNYFKNINELSAYFVSNKDALDKKSHQFVNNYYASDIDKFVLNQVNSHLNTFITSSSLTKKGVFSIREGMTASQSWGPMATSDVGLYGSQMIIAIFPELQKSMMLAHKNLQTEKGEINHGIAHDPDFNKNGTWGVYHRVDLVGNYIQMALRDYFWTNDKDYLIEMWPSIKLGIEYMLEYNDKDGDQMPDMNGIMCSYDNFPMHGLASYIQSQWISALNMASEAARDMEDIALQQKYANIAKKGISLMEDKLWNGSYYSLANDYHGTKGVDEGCLTDQIIGQWVSQTSGMGSIFEEKRVKTALKSILEMSFIDDSFLRNCTWPEYPELYPIHETELWVDQANTPWTGVELAFASFLIYEDMVEDGLKVIKGVDDRYRKSGLYWDHQEFGGHYYRPMSSWSIINAFLGLSINRGVYSFAPKNKTENFKMFFSGPKGTAFFIQNKNSISIKSLTGEQVLDEWRIKSDVINGKTIKVFLNEKEIEPKDISVNNNDLIIKFKNNIVLPAESSIKLVF